MSSKEQLPKKRNKVFIEGFFRSYYKKKRKTITHPESIENREFGFTFYAKEGMYRHIAFSSLGELRTFLVNQAPVSAHYSTAFYRFPDRRDMDQKGWRGAELVFDIDADHLDIKLSNEAFTWRCLECGEVGAGTKEKCVSCGSLKLKEILWPNSDVVAAARREVKKLVDDFLVEDLGVKEETLLVAFSGHRGFHIHVMREDLNRLDSEERREIVDYIKGIGWSLNAWFRVERGRIYGPSIFDPGWGGRVASGFLTLLNRNDGSLPEELAKKKRMMRVRLSIQPALWSDSEIRISRRKLLQILNKVVEEKKCRVDEAVTVDVRRLMRIPNTLHGKTGLKAAVVPLDTIDDFNPFEQAFFKERWTKDVRVRVNATGRIIMNNTEFGPYHKEEVSLPEPVAVFIVLKGGGDVVGD